MNTGIAKSDGKREPKISWSAEAKKKKGCHFYTYRAVPIQVESFYEDEETFVQISNFHVETELC